MPQEVHLHSELDFADFLSSTTSEIVGSPQFADGRWRELTHQTDFDAPISKCVVPVDLTSIKFLVLTEVAGALAVSEHQHSESILRFVLSGAFVLNGLTYQTGDWVYVPANVRYQISTGSGYTTLAGYGEACTG